MQILIVLLLALIALILAPWLLWVIFAGALAYGTYMIIVGVCVVLIIICMSLNGKFRGWLFKRRLENRIEESNRLYREKEAARQNAKGKDDASSG